MSIPKNPTVKLGLDGLNDNALLERGRNHVVMLTGNPAYPGTITPALADITGACNELETSILEVKFNGGKLAHELKRTRERNLVALIKELWGFVQANCKGSVENVLSAGFEVRASGTPVEKLAEPGNLRSLPTQFERLVPLRWDKVKDAVNYKVFVNSTDPNNEEAWELVAITSRTRFDVEDLDQAKYYWFRVQAVGRRNLLSPISQPVKALAA